MSTFRARARTVDLLGRQQIAGIPTAVSELFKNAHDAYAMRVEVDFFRDDELFVLRDDGLGMTPRDFEERWLTLGTESKLGGSRGVEPPPSMAGQKRPILGEKGIGRLAIASIGPQVLVLTRPRLGRERPLTAAFVNWRLFELPGINLDEIQVPVWTSRAGHLPRARDLQRMVRDVRTAVQPLRLNAAEQAAIEADLSVLDFDPAALLGDLGAPRLTGRGHGTHFIVVPTVEQLAADIDGVTEAADDVAPPLVKTLIGFGNTMTPTAPPPRIATAFRDHRSADDVIDIIEANEFFTPTEFRVADHHIDGWFDGTGYFTGTVNVYGQGAEPYSLTFPGAGGGELDCGPFRLQLAYVQGLPRQSRLDPVAYARISAKLDRIGGLYIYRDGIRVLPYGNPDFDFLQIELRRSRHVGRYFFSYRRMFGVIEIDSEHNRELREKAGREGFRDNRAYRQFRDVLRHFFKQVAETYFASRGEESGRFIAGRAEAERRYEQQQARERDAARQRDRFADHVAGLLDALARERPQQEALEVVSYVRHRLADLLQGPRISADALFAAELDGERRLDELRSRYQLTVPAGLGLTPELRREYDYLAAQLGELEAAVFAEAARAITRSVSEARENAAAGPDRHERLVLLVEYAAQAAHDRTDESAREARAAVHGADEYVEKTAERSLKTVDSVSQRVLADARQRAGLRSDERLVERRLQLEQQLESAASYESELLLELADRLRRVTALNGNGRGRNLSDADVAGLLEEEVLELRERVDRDFELAQVGMAAQIITHELDAAVTEVRRALRRLGAWADLNPGLADVHADVRGAFDHLDSYLALFTPLQRRLRRRRERITGDAIEKFLRQLFERRLGQLHIELRASPRFRKWETKAFRSALYPVFINLVDNSTYWVRQNPPPYWIELDTRGGNLLVEDSGPGIAERDREIIFDYGFSRKPGGRGAGLHISREVLDREGWRIVAVNPVKGEGAAFVITAPSEDNDE